MNSIFTMKVILLHALLLSTATLRCAAFGPIKPTSVRSSNIGGSSIRSNRRESLVLPRHFFDKAFEEEGPLGKGITVGKVQIALMSSDRSPTSIYGMLERKAKSDDDSSYGLARLTYDVCMAVLRKSDDWIAASSESTWFKEDLAGRAESKFNDWANKEYAKFEKDYIPDNLSEKGGPTHVVVSMVLEMQGDATK